MLVLQVVCILLVMVATLDKANACSCAGDQYHQHPQVKFNDASWALKVKVLKKTYCTKIRSKRSFGGYMIPGLDSHLTSGVGGSYYETRGTVGGHDAPDTGVGSYIPISGVMNDASGSGSYVNPSTESYNNPSSSRSYIAPNTDSYQEPNSGGRYVAPTTESYQKSNSGGSYIAPNTENDQESKSGGNYVAPSTDSYKKPSSSGRYVKPSLSGEIKYKRYIKYVVYVKRVYKGKAKLKCKLTIYTARDSATCGVTWLKVGKTYLLTGVNLNGEKWMSSCNWISLWKDVTPHQRNSIGASGRYRENVYCQTKCTFEYSKDLSCYYKYGTCIQKTKKVLQSGYAVPKMKYLHRIPKTKKYLLKKYCDWVFGPSFAVCISPKKYTVPSTSNSGPEYVKSNKY